MILTSRFLNLLQGRLALMNREVWALELASLCGNSVGFRGLEHKQAGRNSGKRSETEYFLNEGELCPIEQNDIKSVSVVTVN